MRQQLSDIAPLGSKASGALVLFAGGPSFFPTVDFLLRDFVEMVLTYVCDFSITAEESVVNIHH